MDELTYFSLRAPWRYVMRDELPGKHTQPNSGSVEFDRLSDQEDLIFQVIPDFSFIDGVVLFLETEPARVVCKLPI
jgi:hypothetical protein